MNEIKIQRYTYNKHLLEEYDNKDNLSNKELYRNSELWLRRKNNKIIIKDEIYSVKNIFLDENNTVMVFELSVEYISVDDLFKLEEDEILDETFTKATKIVKYDNVELSKMQPKHLLAVLRRLRRYQFNLYCGCCNEIIWDSDKIRNVELQKEIDVLKYELSKHPHIPTSRERKEARLQRTKFKRDGGKHYKGN